MEEEGGYCHVMLNLNCWPVEDKLQCKYQRIPLGVEVFPNNQSCSQETWKPDEACLSVCLTVRIVVRSIVRFLMMCFYAGCMAGWLP